MSRTWQRLTAPLVLTAVAAATCTAGWTADGDSVSDSARNAYHMPAEGRHTFRFDTFGDEAFWGALLNLNAIVGVTAFFDSGGMALRSVGIQCALCHSTVDDSLAPGIGHRLDGWANRDLNVGAIVDLAPDLSAVATLLRVDAGTVRTVLAAWGKFDAELLLDGKGFRPDGRSAASLIPPAFGLAGVNLHTRVGWGSVTHWNAFVARLEMHGKATFFDSRLSDASQFPVAARAGFDERAQRPRSAPGGARGFLQRGRSRARQAGVRSEPLRELSRPPDLH
jgi:hypothetical protein